MASIAIHNFTMNPSSDGDLLLTVQGVGLKG